MDARIYSCVTLTKKNLYPKLPHSNNAGNKGNNMKMFTIRDSRAECYNTPFFQKSHGDAERSFMSLAQDDKSLISQYPEDFDLYFLGEYDDISGKVKTLDTPQHLLKAATIPSKNTPSQ